MTISWRSRLGRQRPSDVVWKNTGNRSNGSPSRGGPAVPTSTATWVPTVLIYHLCGSLRDHDEDLTGTGTPTTSEEESCVQGSERETTLLDERTGTILWSVAGLRAAPG